MKLATIIVTYHPKVEDVIANIEAFSDYTDILMLWDNSDRMAVDFSFIRFRFPQIIIHQEGLNKGLPIAYNRAIQIAKDKECTHLMTMDQDSTFENFKEYRRQIESFNDFAVGIFTCPINNDIHTSGFRETTVCQSGSIYAMEMLNQIGGFREDLFIGMVDAEMSLRALARGYKIYQIANCNLIQHIGSGRKAKLLGKKIAVSDYGPLRHYYDSRNRILLWHEFPDDYGFCGKLRHLTGRLKVLAKILIFEKNKRAKISAIVKGTYYGLCDEVVPYKP